jgi:hypothetical protein
MIFTLISHFSTWSKISDFPEVSTFVSLATPFPLKPAFQTIAWWVRPTLDLIVSRQLSGVCAQTTASLCTRTAPVTVLSCAQRVEAASQNLCDPFSPNIARSWRWAYLHWHVQPCALCPLNCFWICLLFFEVRLLFSSPPLQVFGRRLSSQVHLIPCWQSFSETFLFPVSQHPPESTSSWIISSVIFICAGLLDPLVQP